MKMITMFQPPTGKLSVNTIARECEVVVALWEFQPPTGKLSVNTRFEQQNSASSIACFNPLRGN